MTKEGIKAAIAYVACITICLSYYAYFILSKRCFIKESGEQTPPNIGLEKWQGQSDHISCWVHWGLLTPKLAMLLFGMAFLIWWLVRDTASAAKIMVYFTVFSVLSYGYLQAITVKEEWKRTMQLEGY